MTFNTVSDENIWAILKNHLPKLGIDVAELIKNEGFSLL